MHCRICGSSEVTEDNLNDIGLDHHSYNVQKSAKCYFSCKICQTVWREDANILNPFLQVDYVNNSRSSVIGSRLENTDMQTASKNKEFFLKSNGDARALEITKVLKGLGVVDKRSVFCEFGANNGSLLNLLKQTFFATECCGIEIEAFQGLAPYDWFATLEECYKSVIPDVFVASHSLLYTNYDEFKRLICSDVSPQTVVLVNPDHLERPAQLFYDDVTTNASAFGLALYLRSCNYRIKHLGSLGHTSSEYILVAKKDDSEYSAIDSQINAYLDSPFKGSSLPDKKKAFIEQVHSHARHISRLPDSIIFGTSIDASLLNYFLDNIIGFTKSSVVSKEEFCGKPVLELESVLDRHIIVPLTMPGSSLIVSKMLSSYTGFNFSDATNSVKGN